MVLAFGMWIAGCRLQEYSDKVESVMGRYNIQEQFNDP